MLGAVPPVHIPIRFPMPCTCDLALERSNLVAACFPYNARPGRNARLPDREATA